MTEMTRIRNLTQSLAVIVGMAVVAATAEARGAMPALMNQGRWTDSAGTGVIFCDPARFSLQRDSNRRI